KGGAGAGAAMAREKLQAGRSGLEDVVDPAAAGEQVADRPRGGQAEQDRGIGEAHVAVDQQGAVARLGEGDGKIDADVGLARASLAGGDGNDAGTGRERDHATTSD